MAKVRIQARSSDEEEAKEEHRSPSKPHTPHHDKEHPHHPGALQILARVWAREGFVGWYRVRINTVPLPSKALRIPF